MPAGRFNRIEGVADREPFIPSDRYDPRNRRMSITLAFSGSDPAVGDADGMGTPPAPVDVPAFGRPDAPAQPPLH